MRIFIIAALACGLAGAALAAPDVDLTRFSLGLGAGQMYGELGTNIEYRLDEQFAVSGGFGLNGDGNWFLGGRMYLKPASTARTRSRITVGVATEEEGNRQPTKLVVAVGGTWSNARNEFSGWNVDISTEGKISFGYSF
ncbi:MAG TPA: hypothetical protein PK794_09445 [Armatimonadota bacterium]|nr:hypothetical protein [Armatimonadota bacterium]